MVYGFKNGAAEAIRIAKQYAADNGIAGLNCVDAQHYDPTGAGCYRVKGLVTWTVRFEGLPRNVYDDESIIIVVNLETGEVRTIGRPQPDRQDGYQAP